MLNMWMESGILLYGMLAVGVYGIVCISVVNRFYSKAIRDLHRMNEPKGKWTKEFLSVYQGRLKKEQVLRNPEAFIRSQMARGKMFHIDLFKWKQGIGIGAVFSFLLMVVAVYGSYQYEEVQWSRYQYGMVGAGIFVLLLLLKQFMGFMTKEDVLLDGLVDYIENSKQEPQAQVSMEELKEQTREELIEQVTEGIRQTAASDTRYSHLLTPEEEHIMREVIREYLA